jgi:hypothetical protein
LNVDLERKFCSDSALAIASFDSDARSVSVRSSPWSRRIYVFVRLAAMFFITKNRLNISRGGVYIACAKSSATSLAGTPSEVDLENSGLIFKGEEE